MLKEIIKKSAKALTGLALIATMSCGGGESSQTNTQKPIIVETKYYDYGTYTKNTPPPNKYFEVTGTTHGEYDIENIIDGFLITKSLLFSAENKYFQIPAKDFEFIKELEPGIYHIDIRLYGENNKKFIDNFGTIEIHD